VGLWRDFETFPTSLYPFLETLSKEEMEFSKARKRNCCTIKELCDLYLSFSIVMMFQ
jgi:hypothetical protein